MNKKLLIALVCILLTLSLVLVACGEFNNNLTPDVDNTQKEKPRFAITLDYGEKETNKTLHLSEDDNLDDYTDVIVGDKAVIGWMDENGNDFDVSKVKEDTTIFPKWGVCVRFFDEDGEVVAKRTGAVGATFPIPTYQSKPGTEFSAWLEQKTHEPLTIPVFPETNVNFFVSFTYSVYHINYNLNGGTVFEDLKTEYTIQSSFDLPKAYKENELFVGWFDEYNNQIKRISSDTTGSMNLTARFTKTSFQKDLRSETATVTDTGIDKQKCDLLDLTRFVNLETLKEYGYNKVEITITMDVREEYDGYQHCYLYSDSYVGVDKSNRSFMGFIYKYLLGKDEQIEDPFFLAGYVFEHGAGERNKNWETYSFTFTLDIDDLLASGKLYVRYSASGMFPGFGINTWQNKNIGISFEAFQE